jgi:hypothetical protein
MLEKVTSYPPADRMSQEEAAKLVEYLAARVEDGYTLLTWNGVGFDLDILAEESRMLVECQRLAVEHVDMMFHLVCQLGFGVSLDAAARGMNIAGKLGGMSGALAPELWAEGRREEVLDYVSHDVEITAQLPVIAQGSLSGAGQALLGGLETRRTPIIGFKSTSCVLSSYSKLSWHNPYFYRGESPRPGRNARSLRHLHLAHGRGRTENMA